MPAQAVLTVGLNPAWQKSLLFDRFVPGAVNRATELSETAGGKAVNAARAVRIAGGRPLILQFAGGETGRLLQDALRRENIAHVTVPTQSRTRVCTTILDARSGVMTELIEPSGHIVPEETEKLLAAVDTVIASAGAAAFCGTWPPGIPASLLSRLVRRAAGRTVVLLDAWRDVQPLLDAGVHILKVNIGELRRLGATDRIEVVVQALFREYPLSAIAVTGGADAAFLFMRRAAWRFRLPPVRDIVNPLGAGDCAAGILALKLAADADAGRALRTGTDSHDALPRHFATALACASASCMNVCPAEFRIDRAREIERAIQIEKIGLETPSDRQCDSSGSFAPAGCREPPR